MKPYDLCRSPAGTVVIYDGATRDERKELNSRLSAASSRVGAKLIRLAINGHDSNAMPHYLLRVTVAKSGRAKKNQGGE